jgi:hypothetical protein
MIMPRELSLDDFGDLMKAALMRSGICIQP